MSDFTDSIRVTDKDKIGVITTIIFGMINSTQVLSLDELKSNKNVVNKLSEDEILATYNLALEIKKTVAGYKPNEELFKYLELNTNSLNGSRLLKFIKQTVRDINEAKKEEIPWHFQLGKIISRLEKNDIDTQPTKVMSDRKGKISNGNGEIIDISRLL